jgi:hypothetical protein
MQFGGRNTDFVIAFSLIGLGGGEPPKSARPAAIARRMRRITIRYVGRWKKSRGFQGGRAASVSGGLSRATGCLPTRDLTVLFVRLASGRADGPGALLKQHKVEKHLLTTGWQATRGTWTAVPPEAAGHEPRATIPERRFPIPEFRIPNRDSRPSAADCHFGSSLAPQPARLWGVPRPLARPPRGARRTGRGPHPRPRPGPAPAGLTGRGLFRHSEFLVGYSEFSVVVAAGGLITRRSGRVQREASRAGPRCRRFGCKNPCPVPTFRLAL